ncbi:LysR family transcriptional regulator [Micromonospora sp. NPDC051141]|uniref:LysR family transcriptional regulator n=1 Tax=Micromonospora sp. NPDC051141 TaxID=3364284 RepID=UPI0037918AD9
MNWEDLKAFRAVAEHRSYTRAAGLLGVARPVLSKRVDRLERTTRARLLTRTTRRVELTAAGRRLLASVDAIDEIWMRTLHEIGDGGTTGDAPATPSTIRLATYSLAVPMLLDAMSDALPGVRWATVPFEPATSLRALRDGGLELVFGYTLPGQAVPALAGVLTRLMVREPMWVAVAEGSAHARRSEVDLGDLRDESWVSRPDGPLHQLLVDACAAAGFVPRVAHAVDDNHAVRALVSSGQAVALCSPCVPVTPGLAVVPVRDSPSRPCFVAWDPRVIPRHTIAPLVEGLYLSYFLAARQNQRYWTYLLQHPEVLAQQSARSALRRCARTAGAPAWPNGADR